MADQVRAEEAEYVRQLEDAAHTLWGELPFEQCELLHDEMPRLVEFLRHLHQKIGHEEAMVRVNVWAESGPAVSGVAAADESSTSGPETTALRESS